MALVTKRPGETEEEWSQRKAKAEAAAREMAKRKSEVEPALRKFERVWNDEWQR